MEFIQDSLFGRTCQEHSAATEEETFTQYSTSSSTSSSLKPRFLRLVKTDGAPPTYMWEMAGASLTGCSMPNIGECPNAAVESTLSQILEVNAHPKYYLSAKACEGILRRAERRGKALPQMLRVALEQQIARYHTP